jgi:cobalt-precorrin 5A hydrolase/precorrin-3B C17-methyltransferase
MTPAIIVLSSTTVPLAMKIATAAHGEVHGLDGRVDNVEVTFENAARHIAGLFREGRPIIAIMASGAIIRILSPLLADKKAEPPVIAVAEDGSSVVPLLGGHYGANELASIIAAKVSGHAAITTAGDIRFGVALDAPPEGYSLANPEYAKTVMAALLNGEKAELSGEAPWLAGSNLPISGDGKVKITITDLVKEPGHFELVFHPKVLALGIGCERGCDPNEALATARQALAAGDFTEQSVGVVVSLDLKADEAAVHLVAETLGCPARFFDAGTLETEAPRLENPSDVVFAEVGCHGVAEGAALAAVGPEGTLAVAKVKSARATAAIAKSTTPLVAPSLPGRARGRIFVVGIGPGSQDWRSPEVSALVSRATDLVGYSLYLDLLGPLANGKVRHAYDLGAEEERVRRAMELAGEGRNVALVCSGDAGIYAMATLVFELIDKGGVSDAARRIGIEVSPGISALQAAAARAGAPLGHDFCTISLSDLLTPWDVIQKRVHAAAQADFVIAFYNPVSRKRRTQLAHARDVLMEYRSVDTPVILATNLGRDGEKVRIVPLGELNIDDVDMLTVVIVGSSQSRVVETGDGKRWVYTPRGYSDKSGSVMKGANSA